MLTVSKLCIRNKVVEVLDENCYYSGDAWFYLSGQINSHYTIFYKTENSRVIS